MRGSYGRERKAKKPLSQNLLLRNKKHNTDPTGRERTRRPLRRRAQCYASGRRGEATRFRPSAAFLASRVLRVLHHVRPRWRRSYGERVRKGRGSRRGANEAEGRREFLRAGVRVRPLIPHHHTPLPCRPPSRPGDSWARPATRCPGCRSARPVRARRQPPLPRVPPVPSRRVPSGAVGRVPMHVGGRGDIF